MSTPFLSGGGTKGLKRGLGGRGAGRGERPEPEARYGARGAAHSTQSGPEPAGMSGPCLPGTPQVLWCGLPRAHLSPPSLSPALLSQGSTPDTRGPTASSGPTLSPHPEQDPWLLGVPGIHHTGGVWVTYRALHEHSCAPPPQHTHTLGEGPRSSPLLQPLAIDPGEGRGPGHAEQGPPRPQAPSRR